MYGGHSRAVGSAAYDAAGNATGVPLAAGPAAVGPFPDQTLGPWFYWAGVNLQSQLGAGAWDASWVMNTFQIVYQVSQVNAPLPGGFSMSGFISSANLQQVYPANPARPGVAVSPTWNRAFGSETSTNSIFVPDGSNISFTKAWFISSFNRLMSAGSTVSTPATGNSQAINNGWTMQQCATETLNWVHNCTFRRGYTCVWRDTYITMSFA